MSSYKVPALAGIALCAAAAAIFVISCSKGSVNSNSSSTIPLASLTSISDCVVDAAEDVEIGGPDALPGCQTVVMEPSSANPASFGTIDIEDGGTLLITGDGTQGAAAAAVGSDASIPLAPLETPVRQICVGNGGTVQYGTAAKPITSKNKVVLEFLGNRGDASTSSICSKGFLKGIEVQAGGSLLMYGAKGVPSRGGVSWTTLAAPAGSQVPGAKVKSRGLRTLLLTDDVTKGIEGWQPGDWVVVATTSYSPFETEFAQIDTVTSGGSKGGSTVTLVQPLKYYHFGSAAPSSSTDTCKDPFDPTKTQPKFLCDGANQNYGVDERAEVGLISRDIELTAATEKVTAVPPPATSSVHWGGEIMIHAGFKQVAIQGVRLSKFGKDKLGSYPIHFHLVGALLGVNKPLIDADSVDHSYNKCVTIHATSNLTISNLVCARIVGQIFYEELNSAKENNPADDSGLVFDHDLGIGAMSNSFDIYAATDSTGKKWTRQQLIDNYWWKGDYMTNDPKSPNYINYDGFNIPDTDNWLQLTRGMCTKFPSDGNYSSVGYQLPNQASTTAACPPADPNLSSFTVYVEPANGFWIQNPGTVLTDDAIAGCQGVGTAFWWGPPPGLITVNNQSGVDLRRLPLGKFEDNRASACYNGYYGENNYSAQGGLLTPQQGGKTDGASIITTFEGMTATHNRFRGMWFRAAWFVIKDSHFSTNKENLSLVTSGGVDGNTPGDWHMLEDSVLVGESQNNVGRWGPCPTMNQFGINTGGLWGCIDRSYPTSGNAHSGAEVGEGYPNPKLNEFGYMLYDGPVRVFHDRFVNFNYNKGWTKDMACSAGAFYKELDNADCTALQQWEASNPSPTQPPPPASILNAPTPYEGDAAFGWFQSNQSAYPTGTEAKELMWVNTNLRHQIYTDLVNVGVFNDGDKNTAIIDDDGTLSGLGVKKGSNATPYPVHAISLNNLPFNATSNSVDECLSRGAQNNKNENRETSLMSPATMGTLEFSDLYPFLPGGPNGGNYPGKFNTHFQYLTFTRTDEIKNGKGSMYRPSMTLKDRDGQGLWEPKVSNGYGYTVTFARIPNNTPPIPPDRNPQWAGVWNWIDVGMADIVDPNISEAHPYYIRLGIAYKSLTANGTVNPPPPNSSYFEILRGYKSYYGGVFYHSDPELLNYWTLLACANLDSIDGPISPNLPTKYGGKDACPAASGSTSAPSPVSTLTAAPAIASLTNANGTPNLKKFYYNPATGYLWLNIAQDEPNAVGPSPTGSCANAYDGGKPDPACPDWQAKNPESYYVCPKNGCIIYTIAVKNNSNYTYTPGPSTGQPLAANLMPAPTKPNQLVRIYPPPPGTTPVIVAPVYKKDNQGIVYAQASSTTAPACTVTQHDGG